MEGNAAYKHPPAPQAPNEMLREEFLPHALGQTAIGRKRVLKAAEALPYNCRMCILLYYYEALTLGDIAQVLGFEEFIVRILLEFGKEQIVLALATSKEFNDGSYHPGKMVEEPVLTRAFRGDERARVNQGAVRRVLGKAGIL